MTPLHKIGTLLRQGLGQIPLPAVRLLFVATLVAVLVWVLCLPREATRPAGRVAHVVEDLKLWAALALLIQLAIYALV